MQYTKQQIKDVLTGRWISGSFPDFAKEICHNAECLKILFELNNDEDPKIAWRSAYLFDMAHENDPSLFTEYIPKIINLLARTTNKSIQRHYVRILAMSKTDAVADGRLVDVCINWLLKEDTPIAVKAHCMQILYKLTQPYPELIPEVEIVLNEVIPNGSKGVANRAKKLLKELKKQSKI